MRATGLESNSEPVGLAEFIRVLCDLHLELLMHERDALAAENVRLRGVIEARRHTGRRWRSAA